MIVIRQAKVIVNDVETNDPMLIGLAVLDLAENVKDMTAEIKLLEALELMQTNKKDYHIGTKCKFSGVYRLDSQYIPLSKNEIFPPANGMNGSCWRLVVKL